MRRGSPDCILDQDDFNPDYLGADTAPRLPKDVKLESGLRSIFGFKVEVGNITQRMIYILSSLPGIALVAGVGIGMGLERLRSRYTQRQANSSS